MLLRMEPTLNITSECLKRLPEPGHIRLLILHNTVNIILIFYYEQIRIFGT